MVIGCGRLLDADVAEDDEAVALAKSYRGTNIR